MAKVIYGRNRLLMSVAELRDALETLPGDQIVEVSGIKQCWAWYKQKVKEAEENGEIIYENGTAH
ncbi:MAG: hypothetical protein LUE89_07440 [Clostridiales bacterium]|nr:hypothetical protein [Clostridiales bacterium]